MSNQQTILSRNLSLGKRANLKEQSRRLRKENDQLRSVFNIATDRFNALKKEAENLKKELSIETEKRRDVEKKNKKLEKELSNERAKANKFASMIFGLKSEKIKLSNIRIKGNQIETVKTTDKGDNPDKKNESKDNGKPIGKAKKKIREDNLIIKVMDEKSPKTYLLRSLSYYYLKMKNFMVLLVMNGSLVLDSMKSHLSSQKKLFGLRLSY